MNFLISGIGGPTPIGIAKSLKLEFPEAKIIGIDANVFAPGLYRKRIFDKTYLVPNSNDTDSYWNAIHKIVEIEKITFAFIVPETEVLQWSKRQNENKLPCNSFVPELDVANFLFNKLFVTNFLSSSGLSVPSIEITNNTDKVELEKLGSRIGYPFWVRLNKTAGALGAYRINSFKELENWKQMNPDISDFMAAEFLPGRNYACKLLYLNGDYIMGALGERIDYLLANASPTKISGMCSRGKLLNNSTILKKGRQALESIYKEFNLPVNGMFTVDFKEDKDGIPRITEINLRHVSFSHAFSLAGANFATQTVKSIIFNSNDYLGDFEFENEINFLRGVDTELFLIDELKQSLF